MSSAEVVLGGTKMVSGGSETLHEVTWTRVERSFCLFGSVWSLLMTSGGESHISLLDKRRADLKLPLMGQQEVLAEI